MFLAFNVSFDSCFGVSQLDDKQRKRMFHQLIQLRYKVSIRAPPANLGKEGLRNRSCRYAFTNSLRLISSF